MIAPADVAVLTTISNLLEGLVLRVVTKSFPSPPPPKKRKSGDTPHPGRGLRPSAFPLVEIPHARTEGCALCTPACWNTPCQDRGLCSLHSCLLENIITL